MLITRLSIKFQVRSSSHDLIICLEKKYIVGVIGGLLSGLKVIPLSLYRSLRDAQLVGGDEH